MKIVFAAILALGLLAGLPLSSHADPFWIYCDGNGSCWVATPSVSVTVPAPTYTVNPSPAPGVQPNNGPVACPGGGVPLSTGQCQPVPQANTGGVNIRSGPGLNYAVVTFVPFGGSVTPTGTPENGWTPVSYNGSTGWMNSTYIGS